MKVSSTCSALALSMPSASVPLKAASTWPRVRFRRRIAPLPVSCSQVAASKMSWRTVAGFCAWPVWSSTSFSDTATSWAARMITSLTTIAVTVAPAMASTVTAFGSLEWPTTTRWLTLMSLYLALKA
ncbi:hypothetical protein D3C87_1576850 [compost metagenome]